MHAADLRCDCGDAATAALLRDALGLEAQEGPEGSHVQMSLDDSVLVVSIEAQDVSTLRATLHSVLRLLDAARRVAGAPAGAEANKA